MNIINQKEIHIIARHSDVSEQEIGQALRENVYNGAKEWQRFFRLLILSFSVGFTVLGIAFFFAFNWESLHKFAKLGLAASFLVASTGLSLHPRFNGQVRNILLTGASVLVGVLFAVYGQIYQTGADTYELFLTWFASISLWVLTSRFAPLWLLYLGLATTAFVLYAQVALTSIFELNILFSITMAIGGLAIFRAKGEMPKWFIYTIILFSVGYLTTGVINIIWMNRFPTENLSVFTLMLAFIVYAAGMLIGIRKKSPFLLAVFPFGLTIIVTNVMFFLLLELNTSGSIEPFIFVGLFVVVCTSLIIKNLVRIKKNLTNGK